MQNVLCSKPFVFGQVFRRWVSISVLGKIRFYWPKCLRPFVNLGLAYCLH